MKFLFLIVFLVGFASQEVFAETEMTGWLRVMDSFSADSDEHPYIFWFQPDNHTSSYRLNPYRMSSSVLDWSGQKVTIKIADNLSANSIPGGQPIEINSIKPAQTPLKSSILELPAPTRSVTLLSKYFDVATTPSESPNTGLGQFSKPQGVAVDSIGNIYVADSFNHRIQKFDSNGNFLLKFGNVGTGPGQFKFPSGVAVDSIGNVYVADNNNHRIQKFDSNGVFLLKFGKNNGDGTSGSAEGQFNLPFGIAVNGTTIAIADTGNHRIQIFDLSGNFIKMIGWGVATGTGAFEICTINCQSGIISGTPGGFAGPRGVAFDTLGDIFVADTGVSRIQKFNPTGNFVSQFGSLGSGNGTFNLPRGVSIDSSNNIYVADTGNNRIQKFDSAGVYQLQFGSFGNGTSQFDSPEGISYGSIFVGDKNNNRIKKFDSAGVFQSVIGYDGSLLHDQTYYKGIFYDNPGSLRNYYLASSYGKFIWNGNVSGWYTVAHPKVSYNNPTNFDLMISDAIAAHDANVNFCNPTPVTNVILIFNGPVSSSTNTAFGSLGVWPNTPQNRIDWPTNDGCFITISVSWEPDNGGFFCCGQTLDRGIGVTAHELGHNQQFKHTPPPPGLWVNAGPYGDPYHDPNSVMSSNRDREGPSPLIAGQRNDAGWIDPGNKISISNGNSQTITLDFLNESDLGPNPQMVTVPLQDGTSYIIEGHSEGLFSDTPQDRSGAIMYRYYPGGNQYAYLSLADKGANYSLVATAGTDSESQFDQAILEVNENFTDNANNVIVSVLAKTSTSVTLFVSNNAVSQCSPIPGSDWIISSSCTITQDVTADKNIIIQNNSVLTIPNGKTLFFHPNLYNLTIQYGSGILVQQGGNIKSIP